MAGIFSCFNVLKWRNDVAIINFLGYNVYTFTLFLYICKQEIKT
jgi:hypothetical protein